jgi:hypothetical protein
MPIDWDVLKNNIKNNGSGAEIASLKTERITEKR